MLNFGLIGAGRIGRIHGGNVARRSDAKLVAIADADAAAAATHGVGDGRARGVAR